MSGIVEHKKNIRKHIQSIFELTHDPIITCLAREKHKHMHRGDVLVDDREKHRGLYEARGVVFVHHKNAEDSLRQLAKIFPSLKAPVSA